MREAVQIHHDLGGGHLAGARETSTRRVAKSEGNYIAVFRKCYFHFSGFQQVFIELIGSAGVGMGAVLFGQVSVDGQLRIRLL